MKIKYFFYVLTCLFLYIQCNTDIDREKYYERPGWLEDPIYQVLQQQGHFNLYLQCVDRTQYADILKGAGLYTVFAPNDDAFTTFLKQNNYASTADIPDSIANNIVAYSMSYNTCVFDSLGVNGAYKYKTQLYALPYQDAEFNNAWVVDCTSASNVWSQGYNNYKFIPTFTAAFFNYSTPPLTAADYNVFFPNVTWSGKNVQGGEIVQADIRAENGIIHEVSSVNLPLDNISDILVKPENSGFKALMDSKDVYGNYLFRVYTEVTDPSTLKALQKIMPNANIQQIYQKNYLFNLENIVDNGVVPLENFQNQTTNTSTFSPEKSGYTLIIPTNEALTNYMNQRVLKYYDKVSALPAEIISALANSHFTSTLVWPSTYALATNGNGDYLNGAGSSGNSFAQSPIFGATLASNGIVYHSNDVVHSRLFESVYSEIFINPAHQWLNIAYEDFFGGTSSLREELQKCILNGYISERYTLITFDDQLLKDDGFSYDLPTDVFSHSTAGVNANNRLVRLMQEHIFAGLNNSDVNSEITDFATPGIAQYGNWNFSVTYYGDPVRYKNNQMQAAGNIEDNTYVNLTKINDTYLNGTVWSADRMLQYSARETGASDDAKFNELSLWEYLDRARTQNPNVKMFVDYLQQCIKTYPTDNTNTALNGITAGQFYTVLMPNTAAMQSAITAGVLPPLDSVTVSNPDAFAQAAFFINSHIIQGRVFVDDNIPNYLYPANGMQLNDALVPVLAKINDDNLGLTNQVLLIDVSKTSAGLLNFVPQSVMQGSTTLVTAGTSGTVRIQRGAPAGSLIPDNFRGNRIACKAILHEVNNYFTFKVAQ